ncbi:MAG: DUF1016 N-terminal domain-containing protein [Lachnospiraceae bacterium]
MRASACDGTGKYAELLSTYWNVGKIIVEYEQKNKDRADYGKQTLKQLSRRTYLRNLEKVFTFLICRI